MTKPLKFYIIFAICSCMGLIRTMAQETHFKNTVKYLQAVNVKERSTIDNTEGKKLIVFDRYENGNKIETFEYYYGNRYLSKFNGTEWANFHDTTHYGFSYDEKGRQIYQLNFDFKGLSENHMYQYDLYGNIERWETGRSYQLSHVLGCTYDDKGTVVKEKMCWADSCFRTNNITDIIHYVKYDTNGLLIEDLVNYMDAMAGYTYSYQMDNQGRIIQKDQTRVWSYFGLDHDIPTTKDIDRTKLYYSWKYEYNQKGALVKETVTEHWREVPKITEMKYNEQGLLSEQRTGDFELIVYEYNNKGLVIGMSNFTLFSGKQKLNKKYTFEYSFVQ